MQIRTNFCILIITTIACLFSCPTYASKKEGRFCVFAIKNSTPTLEDVNSTWRMVSRIEVLPTIPFPIIYPLNRDGIWTISNNNELTFFNPKYKDSIPANLAFDKYTYDSNKKQLFGINTLHDIGVFKYNNKLAKFEKISSDYQQTIGTVRDILYVPYLKKTLVAGSNGLFYIQNDTFIPFLNKQQNIGGVASMHDIPSFKGIFLIMFGSKNEQNVHEAFFFSYDKKLHPITIRLDKDKFKDDYLSSAYETEPVRKILINGGRNTYILNMTTDSSEGIIPDKIEEIQANYHSTRISAPAKFQFSWDMTRNKYSLFYSADTPFATSEQNTLPRFYKIPSRNMWIVLIYDQLYIYKGKEFVKQQQHIPTLTKSSVLKIYDFRSIKRVLTLIENNLYELTSDNQLAPLNNIENAYTMVEMPASKVAIALTSKGIYVIGKESEKRIGDEKIIPIINSSEENAKLLNTGQVFFAANDQLYLIGDKNISLSSCSNLVK